MNPLGWGAFSVSAFDSEWYARSMYLDGSRANRHHVATYGEPDEWPYHWFIEGGTSEAGEFVKFEPRLVSDGGNFDPAEWARLFRDAGARFAGPVAEHHDGFSMWDSDVNEWNSVDKGPGLDLLEIFADAVRAEDMKFMLSMHHALNTTGYYSGVAPQQTESLRRLYGQLPEAESEQLWLDKLKEVIDHVSPDLIWQDFALNRIDEQKRLEFLAYYYNHAAGNGQEVVTTFKDGLNTNGSVLDFERGGPAGLLHPYWLTDDSVRHPVGCVLQPRQHA